MTTQLIPAAEAIRRVADDHRLLADAVAGRSSAELAEPYELNSGPLGHFCYSLHDLVAHILMWDEINLAVLTEARAGRAHWSLDPRWETPDAGAALNRAGVSAGREVDADLLLHRLDAVRSALLAELAADGWADPLPFAHPTAATFGGLAQYVMGPPDGEAFRHVTVHLDGDREEAADAARR